MLEKMKGFFGVSGQKLKPADILLLLLPIVIFFHYYPQISFGEYGNTRLVITLPIIFLAVFGLVSLGNICKGIKKLASNWWLRIFLAFNLFSSISLIWTGNLLRGLLTVGILWLLLLTVAAIISNPNIKKLWPGLIRALLLGAVISSIFAWFQVLADALGAASSTTLLCTGCVSGNYGFARASAFAHEPQFFGSILTIAIVALAYFMTKQRSVASTIILVFLTATMTMTVSRGAILGLVIGVILLLLFNYKAWKRWLISAGFMILGVIIGVIMLGLSAQVNQKSNISFNGAVSTVIYNLTQGVVDFRSQEPIEVIPSENQPNLTDQAYGDNYLDVSANIRTALWSGAVQGWHNTPESTVVGVGAGGTGAALSDTVHGDFAVVQNQYLEVLLEGGIVGFTLFLALIVIWFIKTRKNKVFWAIFAALMVQWCFFSGYYPNSVHIIVFMAFGLAFSSKFARIS